MARFATATICEIRANPDLFVGKMVNISVTYATDQVTYEFVEDPACDSKKTLSVMSSSEDGSVRDFFKEIDAHCVGSRINMCPLEVDVDFTGAVVRDEDGVLAFKPSRVERYGKVRF